jgi:hypothetical protein
MTIADVIEKGAITLKKSDNLYFVEYSNYTNDGQLRSQTFEARNLQLAFMKLEEYLNYSS